MLTYGNLIGTMVFRASLTIVIVFGALGFVVGVGLIVSRARTLRFLQFMNRWISLRPALKRAEIPRDSEQVSHRHRYWVGIALIAGGVFATYGLVARISAFAVIGLVAKGSTAHMFLIVVEALRWFLIVGSVTGVVIGLMLCSSPGALGRFEKYANKWISPRQALRGADEMHPTLDKLAETYPGPAGWILACTGLGAVAYAAFLLLR